MQRFFSLRLAVALTNFSHLRASMERVFHTVSSEIMIVTPRNNQQKKLVEDHMS